MAWIVPPATTPRGRSYFYTKDHYTEEGCWKDDDTTIFAKWDQQGKYRYKKSIFKVVNQW